MMTRFAIDTNRYSDAENGVPEVVAMFSTAEKVYVPFPVIAELRIGFLGGKNLAENERRLQRFLSLDRVEVLHSDDRTAYQYADLWTWLRGRGTPIPQNDVWIAALTVQHGLSLYTRDKHFDSLPQVPRV